MTLCSWCDCVAAALAEVGLDPTRLSCAVETPYLLTCTVGAGIGNEGQTLDYVDRMTDQAIALCGARDSADYE